MNFHVNSLLPAAVLLALVSCAGEKARDPARPTARKPLSQRLDERNGYKQDEAGNWVPRSDKRSSFESVGDSPYFKGNKKKKEFKVGEYQKKSWWGSRDFKMTSYEGNTDGSRFHKTAGQEGVTARENRSAVNHLPGDYKTSGFATGAAREAGMDGVSRVSDAETAVRRRVYQAPEVINWREQRPITREQTKSLLGR